MDVKDLSDDELNYELELRRVAEPSKLTRKRKVDQLRALMRQEHVDLLHPLSATHFISDAANVYYCQQKLQRLGSSLLRALNNQDASELKQCLSKYYHYRARLSLITDPVYAPYVRQAEKVINDSLDQITQCLQSLTYVSAPDFEQGDILPEEEEVLTQLKNHHLQSSVNDPTHTNPDQGKADNLQDPLNLSRKNRKGAISKNADLQNFVNIHPALITRDNGTTSGLQLPQLSQNLAPPIPPPRPSLERDREQHHQQAMVGDQPTDVRDEIIRYLLNNRQHTEARPEQILQNSGRLTPNRQRFSQPVHKWPFSYSGNQNIMELAVFLNRVKTYADTEDVDEFSLLRGVKHLLRGRALEWYTRNYNQFNTWTQFKKQIKAEFLPPNFSQLIKRDLYWRFQGQEETFAKYYLDLLALFEVVEPPLTPQDQFFILKSNLNTEFAAVASASRACTVVDLVEVCKDYDHAKMFSQKNKSSQIPRTALAEPNRGTPTFPRISRQGPPGYAWNRTTIQPNRTQHVNIIEEEELDVNPQALMLQDVNQAHEQVDSNTSPAVELPEEQVNAVRAQGVWNQGDKISETRRKPLTMICWQCEQTGHAFTACRNPKTYLFCYRCGKKEFTSRNCSDCLARMSQALPDSMINPSQGNANAGFQK
ncbi:uncharacterized protein LOC134285737 [Aedes albopictus]|uniref:Retrotransposon gag domain-containing protein n=1 Tax=Aedes albopictus TaxID=7160 RepID=A0ABM1Z7T1_AEDAL